MTTRSTTETNRATAFPDGFLWGASTTAFLQEGAAGDGGAGLSVQQTFAETPGNLADGVRYDRGVDLYGRVDDDVAVMNRLGLQSYRFSISWPRVLPDGTGRINQVGLDHYDALTDRLLEHGITPFPYLYGWDLPVALQYRGGWANRDCANWFADYCQTVFDRLSDRIKHWLTVCEPWSIAHFGHLVGSDGPGVRDIRTALRVGHHLLLAHGKAVRTLRSVDPTGSIGISTLATDIRAASPDDRPAADRADEYFNRLFLDPIFLGSYPTGLRRRWEPFWPPVEDGDAEVISSPINFLGVVYYLGLTVADVAAARREPEPAMPPELGITEIAAIAREQAALSGLLNVEVLPPRGPTTDLGWQIEPAGLGRALTTIRDRYGNPPIHLAENGAHFADDRRRIDFIRRHLFAAAAAIRDGVDLRGWSVWSLFDDPTSRFGLVGVDPATHERTIRASGRWYRDVIEANGPLG